MSEFKEGWAMPSERSKKFHFFRDGKSLCGKWATWLGSLEPDSGFPGINYGLDPGSEADCAACGRKRIKELGGQD